MMLTCMWCVGAVFGRRRVLLRGQDARCASRAATTIYGDGDGDDRGCGCGCCGHEKDQENEVVVVVVMEVVEIIRMMMMGLMNMVEEEFYCWGKAPGALAHREAITGYDEDDDDE
eukprot:1658138-Rhodomonas_salina.1